MPDTPDPDPLALLPADAPAGAASSAGSFAPRRQPPDRPCSRDELLQALVRPDRLLEIVLGAPERLAANARAGSSLAPFLALLLLASTLFALPYGCVIGWAAWWKIAVLYLGSTLLCVPSLHVFATYLGLRVPLAPLLLLALAMPAVAALFTVGFAPILGFLKWTMGSGAGAIAWESLSAVLLGAALFAGIGQLWRCLAAAPFAQQRQQPRSFGGVLIGWLCVFLYVLVRMASVLHVW